MKRTKTPSSRQGNLIARRHLDSTWLKLGGSQARGFALVVVISSLVIISGLLVFLLGRARIDRASAAAFKHSLGTAALRDTVFNLVQNQVNTATGQNDLAWASQPGAIRTFKTDRPDLEKIYKLYSSPVLISQLPSTFQEDLAELRLWFNNPARFTDLNAPVQTKKGLSFPILDPTADEKVEGFDISNAPVASGTNPNAAPMPVHWLYVLENGDIVAPTGPTSPGSVKANVPGASATNPIVARVAFWTDDETCKVNINTATEGTYWDVPRFNTNFERNSLAARQPAQNEFQRYPGHPATTSLAPVFFADNATSTPELTDDEREALYAIVPRVVGGGSRGGTVRVPVSTRPLEVDSDRLYATVDEILLSKNRSTFNSLSAGKRITPEIIDRSRFFLTTSNRSPEITLFNTPRVAIWPTHASDDNRRTAFDRLVRLCATLNRNLYAFQRRNSRSSTADWNDIRRNGEVLRYLRELTDKPIPGFGGKFVTKFGTKDRDQLLVQILDYIRCTNLYDENLPTIKYVTFNDAENALQFTTGRSPDNKNPYIGHGEVVPLRVPNGLSGLAAPSFPSLSDHKGFGRFYTITEAGLHFIAMADGSAGTERVPIGGDSEENRKKRESNRATVNDGPVSPPATTFNKALDGTALGPNERLIQAMLFFEWFSPMVGSNAHLSDFFIEVEQVNGDMRIEGTSLDLPQKEIVKMHCESNRGARGASATSDAWGLDRWGGSSSARAFLVRRKAPERGAMPADGGWQEVYGLVSAPVRITTSSGTMRFTGPDKVVLSIFSGRPDDSETHQRVQTIELKFPDADFPIPELHLDTTPNVNGYQNNWAFHREGNGLLGNGSRGRLEFIHNKPHNEAGNFIRKTDVVRTLVPYHGDYRLIAAAHTVPVGVFQPSQYYFSTDKKHRIKTYLVGCAESHHLNAGDEHDPNTGSEDDPNTAYIMNKEHALVKNIEYSRKRWPDMPVFTTRVSVTSTVSGSSTVSDTTIPANRWQIYGDFDNAHGSIFDGPYINKPDEGIAREIGFPYFDSTWENTSVEPTFFSPNRMMPGPGMFGSLPVHAASGNVAFNVLLSTIEGKAWRTLLFRPQNGHPGANAPKDHLLLDLFWMPVVDPYAISEPLSTAGKVNLNHQIVPFTYIRRATPLVCLLRSEKIIAIEDTHASRYKTGVIGAETRFSIDAHETLKVIDRRFGSGDVYRSATELCDIHLVPRGLTLNSDGSNADTVMKTYWDSRKITGDNSREKPYTNLLGRVTTKSNTFTIHYKVEALKKAPGSKADEWEEGKDSILASLRGSALIERYVDPADDKLPDYATDSNPKPLAQYYRWRVLSDTIFNP